MMEISEKYGFYLPSRDGDDIADINQISENFRIIDEDVPSREDLEILGSNVDIKQDKFADVTERDGAVILTSTVSDDRPPQVILKNGVLELGAMHLQFGDGMGEVSLKGLNAPDDSLNINANDNRIRNVADPKFDKDAVNKKYFERNLPSVDQAYNPESENAQSGIAVAEAVSGKADVETWEHIETITTTEDTKSVSVNKEPNGTPYKFKKMRVIVTNANGGNGNAYFSPNNAQSNWTVSYYLLNHQRAYANMWIEFGYLWLETHSGNGDYSQFHNVGKPILKENIDSLRVSGNGTILAGSTFEIWGVRA